MDTDFFAELERFSLLVRKRVSTAYTGSRRSVRFGHGISPVGYREYRKGDDFKLVDWKVYGRTEKLFIREHEEERSLVVHVLIDSSGSMKYGGKFNYASKLAAGFAFIASSDNEKFSISSFGDELVPGEAKRGRSNLVAAIDQLDSISPGGGTGIKKASEQFSTLVRSTSLVVVISDFLDGIEDVLSAIYRLADHDLILIQVLSHAEMQLQLDGDVKFLDMESGKHVITRIGSRQKQDYARRLSEHNGRIASVCSSLAVDYFSFATTVPIFDAFSEINQRMMVWVS
jgi:uncharacterized protein (DUF58 family)